MAIRRHLTHIKSSVVTNGKPKLPKATDLLEGEIAINFATDHETIAIKNASGDIVTFSSDNVLAESYSSATEVNTALQEKLDTSAFTETTEVIAAAINQLDEEIEETKDRMVEVTYSELKTLRDSSGLTAGANYRITDYVTSSCQVDTRSAGHQFDVIVTATDVDELNEVAKATYHEGDTYFTATGVNMQSWEIKYALDNDTTRFAWAASENGNIQINNAWKSRNAAGDSEGASYPYAWGTGARIVYTANETPTSSDSAFTNSDGTGTAYEIQSYTIGKGVIYYMKDQNNNEFPYDFKNIQFKRYKLTGNAGLVAASADTQDANYGKGIIQALTTWGSGLNSTATTRAFSCGVATPVAGTSLTNTPYVGHQLTAVTIDSGATYMPVFYNSKYVYCKIDSEVYLYTFQHPNTDKEITLAGTKYWNNIVQPYMSNHIRTLNNNLFLIFTGETSNYASIADNTFGTDCYNNTLSHRSSGNTFGNLCYGNTFGNTCRYNSFGNTCQNNSFGNSCQNNSFGNTCAYNSFGNSCYYNSFGNSCYYNSFGNSCQNNSFGNQCYYNSFGNTCYYNSFGNTCYSNSFGNQCNSNSFGNSCYYNSFGNTCQNNSFGNTCYSNSFGNSCYRNSFGNQCYYNSFGNQCYYNSFGNTCTYNSFGNNENSNSLGNECSYITLVKDYCYHNIVENGNKYITLTSSATTSDSLVLRNITVAQGVNNTTSAVTISHPTVNDTFKTTYQPAASKIINL